MALKTMIANLKAARDNYNKQLDELGKQAKDAIEKELAPLVPDGYVLHWNQYTPYFNDGDPCEFGVHDPFLSKIPEGGFGELNNWDGDICSWNLCEGLDPAEHTCTTEQAQAVFDGFKELPEDLLERAFGDHTSIYVTKDGATTEECEHD